MRNLRLLPKGAGPPTRVDIDSMKEKLTLAFQYINKIPDDTTPTPVIGVYHRKVT
jgi:hypothetical protein